MMAIISAMAGGAKVFPVQFNDNAAWQVSNTFFGEFNSDFLSIQQKTKLSV
jgi:hypothetical protein